MRSSYPDNSLTRSNRPLSVTIVACVYIAVGFIGFAYHFHEFQRTDRFDFDLLWIESLRVLAIVAGLFLLRGRNWARWLALVWIAFHVILSAFHTLPEFAMHCLFCGLIAWLLFGFQTGRYFRNLPVQRTG